MATVLNEDYPARLEIDYPERLSRMTTLLRVIWIIPILLVYLLLTSGGGSSSIEGGLFLSTLLLILFRRRYPRWWFDFALELTRLGNRIGAYGALLTDTYPSSEDEQTVHIELDYPDAKQDLNRWLPLIKWLLALPHYIVLIVLGILAFFAILVAWVAILITGRYPQGLFNFVVGVGRWSLRVQAYAFLLITDRYPPFRLGP
jgi:Domain of unknown function (DUF4389)